MVDCGGMFAAEIGRLAGIRVPIVPMSHQYVVTEPLSWPPGPARCRRCATPTCWSTTGRRSRACVMGGYERAAAPFTAGPGLRRRPGGLQRQTAARRLGPVRRDRRERRGPGAGDGRRRGPRDDQRPGGLHPGQRVLPRPDRGGRASSSPPASARTASPGAGGIGQVMAEWIARRRARAGPVAHGHQPVRPRSTARRATRWPASVENYQTYYDIRSPGAERARDGRCAVAAYAWHAAHGADSGRRPAGSG